MFQPLLCMSYKIVTLLTDLYSDIMKTEINAILCNLGTQRKQNFKYICMCNRTYLSEWAIGDEILAEEKAN